MISAKELNPNNYPLDDECQRNFDDLLMKLNKLRAAYGKPIFINSGVRNAADQQRINPKAPKSKHLKAQAADMRDNDGALWKWCMDNIKLMEEIGLWFEDKSATPTWVHAQSAPPASGRRVFMP